jgi:hypothetical protein
MLQADAAGAFSIDAAAGETHAFTASATGYMPQSTSITVGPRYTSTDLYLVQSGLLGVATRPAGVSVEPGMGHVLVVSTNCGAGLTATAGSLKTLYLGASRLADPNLTATSDPAVAAIVNAPPGPLAVSFAHPMFPTVAPLAPASESAGPVTVQVAADTITLLQVACLPQ